MKVLPRLRRPAPSVRHVRTPQHTLGTGNEMTVPAPLSASANTEPSVGNTGWTVTCSKLIALVTFAFHVGTTLVLHSVRSPEELAVPVSSANQKVLRHLIVLL